MNQIYHFPLNKEFVFKVSNDMEFAQILVQYICCKHYCNSMDFYLVYIRMSVFIQIIYTMSIKQVDLYL